MISIFWSPISAMASITALEWSDAKYISPANSFAFFQSLDWIASSKSPTKTDDLVELFRIWSRYLLWSRIVELFKIFAQKNSRGFEGFFRLSERIFFIELITITGWSAISLFQLIETEKWSIVLSYLTKSSPPCEALSANR